MILIDIIRLITLLAISFCGLPGSPLLTSVAGGSAQSQPASQPVKSIKPSFPKLIKRVKPAYPVIDQACLKGLAILCELEISRDGTVRKAKITKSCGCSLWDEAALTAIKKWRFSADGFPKNVDYVISMVNINLNPR